MKEKSKIRLISLLTELNRIDEKLYNFLDPDKRYPKQREGWWFLGYENILNVIYYEFCGKSEREYYKEFKACKYDREDKPVAWYKGRFSFANETHIKGPRGLSGFIPDCINDTILSYKLNGKQKLKLLNRMFKDLEKLKESHISNG